MTRCRIRAGNGRRPEHVRSCSATTSYVPRNPQLCSHSNIVPLALAFAMAGDRTRAPPRPAPAPATAGGILPRPPDFVRGRCWGAAEVARGGMSALRHCVGRQRRLSRCRVPLLAPLATGLYSTAPACTVVSRTHPNDAGFACRRAGTVCRHLVINGSTSTALLERVLVSSPFSRRPSACRATFQRFLKTLLTSIDGRTSGTGPWLAGCRQGQVVRWTWHRFHELLLQGAGRTYYAGVVARGAAGCRRCGVCDASHSSVLIVKWAELVAHVCLAQRAHRRYRQPLVEACSVVRMRAL